MEFLSHKVYQQSGNWCVLDEDFPWDIRQLKLDVFALIGMRTTPVFFCDTCDANQVLSYFGEEEEEFLYPINGFYHRDKQFVFICSWESYEQVLETLLHEFRHDMQYEDKETRALFYHDSQMYEKKWIEMDARAFAEEKMKQYRK